MEEKTKKNFSLINEELKKESEDATHEAVEDINSATSVPKVTQHITAENITMQNNAGNGSVLTPSILEELNMYKGLYKSMKKDVREQEDIYEKFKKEYDKILDLKNKQNRELSKENEDLREENEMLRKKLDELLSK